MAEKARFVTRVFHCPRCDRIFEHPILAGTYKGVERVCPHCIRKQLKEDPDAGV